MRKIKVLLMLFAIIIFTPFVYAGTAYVDSIDIDANINSNGSMDVVETIVWDIEEDLNGVYRDILITNSVNKLNGASNIAVNSVVVNGVTFNYSANTLSNGAFGAYNVNSINGGKQIKIFRPSEDEHVTTVISYTLYDVVVEYLDTAELYWNFIGSGWDYGIDNVNINISLPGIAKDLRIFAHGPLNGYSEIVGKDTVKLNVDNLRSGEQVDARLIFDNSLVNASKIVKENKLESILLEEAEIAEAANMKRELFKKIIYGSIIGCGVGIIVQIIIGVIGLKKAPKAKFYGKYYRELPEDYGPAVMNKVLSPQNQVANTRDLLATLLDLVRKKYVVIEPVLNENKRKPKDYILKLVNDNLENLSEVEKDFIQKLIFVNAKEISLKELEKKNTNTSNGKTAYYEYSAWSLKITEEAKKVGVLKTGKKGTAKYVIACLICLIIPLITAIYGATSNYEDILIIGVIGIILNALCFINVVSNLNMVYARTDKGVEHNAMWKAFKRFLLDFSKLDERDYEALVIWEHFLVYAAGLGIAKKVIKQLKLVYPTEFKDDSNWFGTYTTLALLSDDNFSSFGSSFTSATSTAFSNSSSSNGSGGGFSGGGGFRRWRRRWWRFLTAKQFELNLKYNELTGEG